MKNNRSYLKRYLTYSLQFLLAFELMMLCSSLAMSDKQAAMEQFVAYQITYISLGGIFFLLLLLFRTVKKDTYTFYFLFYGCLLFLATISDMEYFYYYYTGELPHFELKTLLTTGLTRSSYFCIIIVASYTMLKKYIMEWKTKSEKWKTLLFTIRYSLFIIRCSLFIIR